MSTVWVSKAQMFVDFKGLSVNAKELHRQYLLTIDGLKCFIKSGDNVVIDSARSLTTELRSIIKTVKSWKIRFDRFTLENGTKDDLRGLIDDSEHIAVDLSEFTDILSAQTKSYCLCRQLYFGDMVGCDSCDEWYHFSCIGIVANNAVVNKLNDTYVCVRCALKNSFNYSAELVANLTNKWMQCADHFKVRDLHLQKVFLFFFFFSFF